MNAVRRDLVDIRFAGRVFAPHYAVSVPRTARVALPLREKAAEDSPILSELLPGDPVEVFELAEHRAWGQSLVDGAVGHFAAEELGPELPAATHLITVISASLTAEPYPDAPACGTLPMGAQVHGTPGPEGYLDTQLGYLSTEDLRAIAAPVGSPVDWAEAMLGIPYRPGGRSGAGVDAGGMIFLAHQLAGVKVPRFIDLQAQAVGVAIDPAAPLQRGDMLFFENGAVIMADATTAIHVSEGAGVVKQSLETAIESGALGAIVAHRRTA